MISSLNDFTFSNKTNFVVIQRIKKLSEHHLELKMYNPIVREMGLIGYCWLLGEFYMSLMVKLYLTFTMFGLSLIKVIRVQVLTTITTKSSTKSDNREFDREYDST